MNKRPSPPPPPGPPPSNREKMKTAIGDLMNQVAEQKASSKAEVAAGTARRKRKQRSQILQALLVLVALIISVVVSMPRWQRPFDAPSGAKAEHDARKALVFTSTLIDSYERRSGRLPGSLSQIGVDVPGVAYVRTGDTWVLSTRANDRLISFSKGMDAAGFLAGH